MFVFVLFSCMEDVKVDAPESSEQLAQDVDALKEMFEQQSNQLQSLQEDYELLLGEYNTLMGENQNQQAEIEALHIQAETSSEEISNIWASLQQNIDATPQYILIDTTWLIDPNGGGDYTSLSEADEALDNVLILPAATLTLQLADGTHQLNAAITLEHPNGDRIVLEGNEVDPSAVVLDFEASNGLEIHDGNTISKIRNLSIQGDRDYNGFWVSDNSFARIENISIEGFSNGITIDDGSVGIIKGDINVSNCLNGMVVSNGSVVGSSGFPVMNNNETYGLLVQNGSVYRGGSVQLNNNGSHGLQVFTNSVVYISNLEAQNNSGSGVSGWFDSSLYLKYVIASNNGVHGLGMSYNSTLNAFMSQIEGNSAHGVLAQQFSYVILEESNIANNAQYGSTATYGSGASVSGAVFEDNVLGGNYTDESSHLFSP